MSQKFSNKEFTLQLLHGTSPLVDSVRDRRLLAEPVYETDSHVLSISDATSSSSTTPNIRPVAAHVRRRAVSSSPDNASVEDHYLGVDSSGAAITVNLPAASDAVSGKVLIVKDEAGNAGSNNITISPDGSEQIDGSASYTISTNYGVVHLISTGSGWAVAA